MATFFNPFTYISDPTRGRPVFNGRVFFGRPDTDPTVPSNQIVVNQVNENGSFTPIPQPVRTGPGGVLVGANGSPIQIDLPLDEYSMTIQDAQSVQRYYTPRIIIIDDIQQTQDAIRQFRSPGTHLFITPAMNNGTPFRYPKYARVAFDPGTGIRIYESQVNDNTALPTVTAKLAAGGL